MEIAVPVIAGESNIGFGRRKNEDNYCIAAPPGFVSRLAVVADGIGGHADGDVASMCCCRWMMHDFLHRGGVKDDAGAEEFLRSSLGSANERIFRRNEFDRRVRPMGCTAVCAVFSPGKLTYCGVGDSRLYDYDFASGMLRQLSVDDVACDGTSLCRAIGIRRRVEIEPSTIPLAAGHAYLLCSDGLHHFVGDDEIADVLSGAESSRMAVSMLMRRAILHAVGDNITVVAALTAKPGVRPLA